MACEGKLTGIVSRVCGDPLNEGVYTRVEHYIDWIEANARPDDPETTTEQGSTEQGSTEQGSTDQGSTEHGSTDQGSTEQGSTDQGSTDQGSTDQGSTEQGSTEPSTTQSRGPLGSEISLLLIFLQLLFCFVNK